ncbi:MAG TPA: HAMP domain-containing histidine kinase [Deltaproteobacteria bacterium]|nr:HAMP domain-containing histidine kinase [Deltaproteobacteria bacterium]
MKKPIFLKIFSGYLLICLALSSLILLITFNSIRTHFIDTTISTLVARGTLVTRAVHPLLEQADPSRLQALVTEMGSDIATRITIINNTGVVVADSVMSAESSENHRFRPEVSRALSGEIGHAIRYSTSLDDDLLYVALPVELHGKIQSVVRLSLPLKDIQRLLDTIWESILQLTVLVILFSVVIALIFSHILSTPIRDLNRASKKVASGNFDVRVTIHSRDELRELAESFNEMTAQLRSYFSTLSQRNEELEGILASMSEELLVLDREGIILLTNESASELFDVEPIRGRYFWEVVRSLKFNSLLERSDTGPVIDDVDLGEKTFLVSITPLRSGNARVVLFHNITEMKRLEKIKRDLVVNVSHELRTPLTAIKGFTETLLDGTDEHISDHLKVIQRHTDRLINIVNDLLDLSTLEEPSTALNLEEIELRTLLEKVSTAFELRIKEKNLEVTFSGPSELHLQADPFRLEQLFGNLIDNALKYTEHGSMAITFQENQNSVIIEIADTGIGIPKEHLPRIYERFYVVDKSRSRLLGGTGLGLAIVKHIVSTHNGSIKVASTPGAGTAFTVTLPKRQPERPPSQD